MIYAMRESTKEEDKSVNDYIESISSSTGINFLDLIDAKVEFLLHKLTQEELDDMYRTEEGDLEC